MVFSRIICTIYFKTNTDNMNDKVRSVDEKILSKKSPDGRYMLYVVDDGETCNGLRICKVMLENRISRDTRSFDFAYMSHSRRKELYWGICSLLFLFYSFDKSSLKEFLVVCDIGKQRYARLDISKAFCILTSSFPMLKKRMAVSKVKSNLSK